MNDFVIRRDKNDENVDICRHNLDNCNIQEIWVNTMAADYIFLCSLKVNLNNM